MMWQKWNAMLESPGKSLTYNSTVTGQDWFKLVHYTQCPNWWVLKWSRMHWQYFKYWIDRKYYFFLLFFFFRGIYFFSYLIYYLYSMTHVDSQITCSLEVRELVVIIALGERFLFYFILKIVLTYSIRS